METSAPPQCQDCDRPLSLVTAVDGFFDRPPVRTFKCEKCSRLVVFSLEDGRLRLMDPALLAEFCDEYTRHMNKLRMESNASLGAARGELARLAKQRENIIEAIKDGVPATEVKDDLARVVTRREELETLLSVTKKSPFSCIRIWQRNTTNGWQILLRC